MNVKTLCLGLLLEREASGYELKKCLVEGKFSRFTDASYGSIYPALNQLAQVGDVTVRIEQQTAKPAKKIYTITPQGRNHLVQALSGVPQPDKYRSDFMFQMLFQQVLPAATIHYAVQQQIECLTNDLEQIQQCKLEPNRHEGQHLMADYYHAMLSAGLNVLRQKNEELEKAAKA